MPRYQQITALQEPFDLGPWEGYTQWVFNVQIERDYSETQPALELAAVIEEAGLGVHGRDVFTASVAKVPSGAGPYVFVTMYGGLAPVKVQNRVLPAMQRPTAQIMVRAKDNGNRIPAGASAAAEQRARAVYAALVAVVNRDITGVS